MKLMLIDRARAAMRRAPAPAATVSTWVLAALLAAAPAYAVYDIPTGAPPSPLFGAEPFTQQMLLFEEFGMKSVPTSNCRNCKPFPQVADCSSSPTGAALDAYLQQTLSPLPTVESNQSEPNVWHSRIEQCLGRTLLSSYSEGRPPGVWFAHQRWNEFKPKEFVQTATAGARDNGGMRDRLQRHGYRLGEFGPGGLYHNTAGAPGFNGTTRGLQVRLHPNMPVQERNSVWTFDGSLPPKLMTARYGMPVLFRHHNALPIDEAANNGFGHHTVTTHHHNGHNPGESDGFAGAYFYPGQYYDYRWPMILAGYDTINTAATDRRAGAPNGRGGITRVKGDWRETMSSLWFHDHMHDFTAQNVYKGNAAAMNLYSAVDRGNEGLNDGVNLRLPSGTALDWGNRDYDVNLVIADKAWDARGQLFFNIFNLDGFLGDRVTVNWLYKPYLEVRARRYRFRILNGSVSRYWKYAVVDSAGNRVPVHMVANDGNIMQHAIPFPNAQSQDLPTQAIGERYDLVIDFSKFPEGERLYLVNLMEHQGGRGPEKDPVPLAAVLNGTYQGDPAVGKFLEFRVRAYQGVDQSMNPADYEPGKKQMIPLPAVPSPGSAEYMAANHRTFEFGRSGGTDKTPWTVKVDQADVINGQIDRTAAEPDKGALEIWHFRNGGNGWSHPVHVHFEEAQILAKDGQPPPIWEQHARKDMFRVGPEIDSARDITVAIRTREFMGTYVEHCHNTQHEDHAMLLRWDIKNPGQTVRIPSPFPDWEGVRYIESGTIPSAETGVTNKINPFGDTAPR
ncbi:MAG: multicopper oxidase domain-containing protein [Pseudomonadales bacterium]